MTNNRNESERRYFEEGRASFDERGHGSRNDRDYDLYRHSHRDREIERGDADHNTGWRGGSYGDRFARRSSENRDFSGQYAAFDRDYDYVLSESNRHHGIQNGYARSAHENWLPDWRIQGLHSHGIIENDYSADSLRGTRGFTRENHVGRGPKGYRRSDERIKEDVCDILERHPAIDASEIEITVNEGVVVLRGAVENRTQKRLTEDAIENLTGVKDIRNELSINQSLFERSREFTAQLDHSASKEPISRTQTKSARP